MRRIRYAAMVCSAVAAPGQQEQWYLDCSLPGDFQGQAAYDEARERVVLYGAEEFTLVSAQATRSRTYEWDGQNWQHRATEVGHLHGTTLCYDAGRQRVVRLGGNRNWVSTDEIWEWDGQIWQRQAAGGPPARTFAAAAFHAATNRVLLCSGIANSSNRLGDTWERTANGWTLHTTAPTPAARWHHAMAYDAGRQRTVLFGGAGFAQPANDTWEWDGAAWLARTTATTPPGRMQTALAYDPQRARVVMFGGRGITGLLADTWEWDGLDWHQRAPSRHPEARNGATMAFAGSRDRLLLFGGVADSTRFTDTWTFDGTDWHLRKAAASPPTRGGPMLVHDLGRGNTVLFGGYPPDDRTWQHDGHRWQSMPTTQAPAPRHDLHAAFDLLRGRTVLFGGRDPTNQFGDTWEWDGAAWTQHLPAISPAPRSGGCMAFDLARGVAVLFGGRDFGRVYGETWEWNGSTWQQRLTAHVPQGTSFGMTYDWGLGRIVMFGGSDLMGPRADTWHYDGLDWTAMGTTGPSAPPPRVRPALTYHLGRGRTVLFGGGEGNVLHDDLWEWNGAQWTPWQVPVRAEAQHSASMAYDANHDRLLLTGGWTTQTHAATWWFAPGGPAAVTGFGAGCGQSPPAELRSDLPFQGNLGCAVELVRATPASPVLLLGGLGQANVALPGGCRLLVQAPLVTAVAVTNAHGSTRFPMPVPWQPALRGATIVCQTTVFDGRGPLAGTSWTPGVQLRVGQ